MRIEKEDAMMMTLKSLDDLTVSDLGLCPVWEVSVNTDSRIAGRFAVTPRPGLSIVDPSKGTFIVKTEFFAESGRRYVGYCSPSMDYDLGCIRPTVLRERGDAARRPGFRTPTVAPWRRRESSGDARKPVAFRALVQSRGARLEGIIPGSVE